MTDMRAIRDTIAGFLDRDALGAPGWTTPQEGAVQLLALLQSQIAERSSIDVDRVLSSYMRHESGLGIATLPAEMDSGATSDRMAAREIVDWLHMEDRIGEQQKTVMMRALLSAERQQHPDTTTGASGQAVARPWPEAILERLGVAARSASAVGLPQIVMTCEDAATEIILLHKAAIHPAPSAASVRAEAWHLVGDGKIICAGDEILSDDTVGWEPLAGWEIGLRFDRQKFMPLRRRALQTPHASREPAP